MNYLYNGVELPDIDTIWTDKETYRGAMLKYKDASRQAVSLCLVKGIAGFTLDLEPDNANRDWAGVNLTESGWARYDLVNGEWVLYSNYDTQRVTTGTSGDVLLFWSSSDIYSQDTGKLYLAASDPIPVGSAPDVEPKSFMAGWRMGQFIRGMRG